MDKTQKIFTSLLWGILVLAMISIVGTGLWAKWRAQNPEMPVLFDAPEFALTDQNGRTFGSADLRGSPYVVDFIFTHCAGVCPIMTQKMREAGAAISNPSVHFVSFTVDPKNDTPEVLNTYADRYNTDASRWHFLTGTQEQMNDAARGMKMTAMPMADGSSQFLHDEHFLLVDGEGQVRGIYSTREPEALKRLVVDANRLARESSSTGGRKSQ